MTGRDSTWSPFDESSIELDGEVLGECEAQKNIAAARIREEIPLRVRLYEQYYPLFLVIFALFGLKSAIAIVVLLLYSQFDLIVWGIFTIASFILCYLLGVVLRGEGILPWHVIYCAVAMYLFDMSWTFFSIEPFLPVPAKYEQVGYYSLIMVAIQVGMFWMGLSVIRLGESLRRWNNQIKIVTTALGVAALMFILLTPQRSLGFHAGVEEFTFSSKHEQIIDDYQQRMIDKYGAYFNSYIFGRVRSYRSVPFAFNSHFKVAHGWYWTDSDYADLPSEREIFVDPEQEIWLYRAIGEDGHTVFSMLVQIQDGRVLAIW